MTPEPPLTEEQREKRRAQGRARYAANKEKWAASARARREARTDEQREKASAASRLIGQQVLVWHDVEEAPASITITDLQRRNGIEVPRVDPLPALTATGAQIGAAQSQAAAHGSHQRTLYRTLEPFFQRSLFQPVKVDAATVELGETIAAGRAKVSAARTEEKAVAARVATVERQLGFAATKPHRNLSRKLDGLEMLRRADELDRLEEEAKQP